MAPPSDALYIQCRDCGHLLRIDPNEISEATCDQCGSCNLKMVLRLGDDVKVLDTLSYKLKDPQRPSRKKVRVEGMSGADQQRSTGRWVQKERVIDRDSNRYFERVVDPDSGQPIHQCEEPLTAHQRHGSARASTMNGAEETETWELDQVGVGGIGATEDELKSSPFYDLYVYTYNATAAVNPGAVRRLLELIEGTTPVLVVEPGLVCDYDPETGTIRISTGLIELAWAAALAYYLLYKDGVEGTHGGSVGTIDPVSRLGRALENYRWHLERAIKKDNPARPADAPVPTLRQPSDEHPVTPEEFASELALGGLGFSLHHELGHHVSKHPIEPPGDEAIAQEREADNHAIEWVYDGAAGNGVAEEKARLSVAISFGIDLACHTIRWRKGKGTGRGTHPPPHHRMYNLVEAGEPDPTATSWGMVIAILQLHMCHVGIEVPRGPFKTHQEAASCLVDRIDERLAQPPPFP